MAASSTANQPRNRISFAKFCEPLQVLNLLGLQAEGFGWLLGNDVWKACIGAAKVEGRIDVSDVFGPEEIFEEVSPTEDLARTMSLSFRDHRLERPNYSVEEAKTRDYTYSALAYVTAESMDYETGEIRGQAVFMGDFPFMTPCGIFTTNGTEHVVVSQLVRSPGIYFEHVSDRSSDRDILGAKIILSRGAWLEFEIDKRDAAGVHIDRKRRQLATHSLKAIGLMEARVREEFVDYPVLLRTLEEDMVYTQEEALLDVYRKFRPGEPVNIDSAQALFNNLYFDDKCYDLAKVGRYKINKKPAIGVDPKISTLSIEDVAATVRYLLALHKGEKTFAGFRNGEPIEVCVEPDDIDHFGNRHIRAVGEFIQAQTRNGLACMERTIRERMTTQEHNSTTPQMLINIRPVVAAIKEFFGIFQLPQFTDQNNPLAGPTHERRLPAFGPGGFPHDRADMEVRDVHPSHYGRVCPTKSSEGPNTGLIGSLVIFARINPFNFIETSYRVVRNGKITDGVGYLTADDENGHFIVQASPALNEGGTFTEEHALCRVAGEGPTLIARDRVDYMDASACQMVSVAAASIPFLEHDDANRALMGVNMQRQAVPLLMTEAPLVGTGMERHAVKDSSEMVIATDPSVVTEVPADLVIASKDEGGTNTYRLKRLGRPNPNNRTNQRITVDEGDRVEAGMVLADSPATDNGEVVLGKNLLVAYTSWEGLNYEDAVILPCHVVEEDVLTSIHIEEHEVDARETKPGEKEITRGIPNVSEEALANLDERGIIRIGAEVTAGDIFVGKVTPKGETKLTSEGRFPRAIFGEKAREVRDISLRVPYGQEGIVIGVREFNDEEDDLNPGVRQTIRVYIAQRRKITIGDKMAGRHGSKGVVSKILPVEDIPFLEDDTPVDVILNPLGVPGRMNVGQVLEYHLDWLAHQGWDVSKAVEVGESWIRDPPAEGIITQPQTLVATSVFDGLETDELAGLLCNVNPSRDGKRLTNEQGKACLFDDRSGEPFPYPTVVGHTYMLKFHHLVDDRVHVRSTGPYPMITQQPLGGKAQFGGQRFGEMEVWTLEAYGVAYALQELLTIKSDDMTGRVKVYEATVKGEDIPESGIPESFRVLIQEMRPLCLNAEAFDAAGSAINLCDREEDFNAHEDLDITLEARPGTASTTDAI